MTDDIEHGDIVRNGQGLFVCVGCLHVFNCMLCEQSDALARHCVSHPKHGELLVCSECMERLTLPERRPASRGALQ